MWRSSARKCELSENIFSCTFRGLQSFGRKTVTLLFLEIFQLFQQSSDLAVSIHTWLEKVAQVRDPQARELTITADCGGSNGSRVRLWRVELHSRSMRTKPALPSTCGTTRQAHRNGTRSSIACSAISRRTGATGRSPITSQPSTLIAATTAATGLKVEAVLDTTVYEKGIKIRDAEMKRLHMRGGAFHPEWSYTVTPTSKFAQQSLLRLSLGLATCSEWDAC
jgi:hypothetical protein